MGMLENDTRTGPPNSVMFECPVTGCPWRHQQTEPIRMGLVPPVSAGLDGFEAAMQSSIEAAMGEANKRDDAALLAHLRSHHVIDFAETIAQLRGEVATLRAAEDSRAQLKQALVALWNDL